MTDEELAEAGQKIMELEDRSARIEQRIRTLKTRIRTEMEERGTRGLVTNGIKLTYVAPVVVEYDAARLQRALGSLWSEATDSVLNKGKLLALVQEGKVPLAKVDRCATETPRTPYVLVNLDRP